MNTQVLSEYLDFLEIEKGLSENTLEAYRRDLTDFFDFCNDVDINNIQRTQINTYIRKLHEKKYSPTSVMRKIASLRGFFKWACANEKTKSNPTLTLELFVLHAGTTKNSTKITKSNDVRRNKFYLKSGFDKIT